MKGFHIIVSAENNAYMAWQCKLFHYSCVSRVGMTPTIFVHDSGHGWHPGFYDIVRAGGHVHGLRSYAYTSTGSLYQPRNTAGTLIEATDILRDDYLVLCDPDMIFLRKPNFEPALSGSFYSGMDYNKEEVLSASSKLGIPSEEILNRPELRCGVPHVIPIEVGRLLGQTWLRIIDQFALTIWEVSMYALGLAVTQLKMPIRLNSLVGREYRMISKPDGDMIHYCYSRDLWDKRLFYTEEAARRVWAAQGEAPEGTIMAEILQQLREARDFYFQPSI